MIKLFGRLKKENNSQGEPVKDSADSGFPPPMPPQKQSMRPRPEERVSSLLSQGFAEPDIIRIMKQENYSFQEIDSGISNVLKQQVSNQQAPPPFEAPQEDLSPIFHQNPDELALQQAEEQNKEAMIEEMDEVIETLIEEKISDVHENLNKMDKKISALDEKIGRLMDKLNSFEGMEKSSGSSVLEKINEVNSKEESIEPRIASLEKAFKDIIPNLVDSIREMRETVASVRERRTREVTEDDVERETEDEYEKEARSKGSIFD